MTEKKLKRLKSKAASAGPEKITESAHHIWLAGLGALSKAQAEGSRFFDLLVHEGETLESKSRDLANQAARSVREKLGSGMRSAKTQAGQTLGKLESVFETRVQRVLNHLGVPTRDDIKALNERVEALTKTLAALKKKPHRSTGKSKKASSAKPN